MTSVIAAVHAGEVLFSPGTLARAARRLRISERTPGWDLTEREREVLALLAQGMSTPALAESLSLSVHTVRTHIQAILEKVGAHSKLEAVALALRAGIIRIES